MERWKGVKRSANQDRVELFDLPNDIGEAKDVSDSHPDIVKRMEQIMKDARTDSVDFPVNKRAGR